MNYLAAIFKNPSLIVNSILGRLPDFFFLRKTTDYQSTISFSQWFKQKILNIGGNSQAYWPVNVTSKVVNPENILVGVDAYPGYMGGNYIQGIGKIYIGDYTQIGPNVNIISANHDLHDTRVHIPGEVVIGKYCWLGAGCSIMPGVILGDFTIVGAGAVVTRSFEDGYCVIGGNTAKVIKQLDPSLCVKFTNKHKFNGYIESNKFEKYRSKNLNV